MAIIDRFNVGGTWKSPTEIYVNAGGNWKSVTEIKIAVERTDNLFDQVSSGYKCYFTIDEDKIGWGWGYNNYGQLGINNTICKDRTASIYGQHKFSYINSSSTTTYGLDTNKKLWGWGENTIVYQWGDYYGSAIGDNTMISRSTPVAVYGNHTFNIISPYLGVDNNNKTWSWGLNKYGVVGDNTITHRSTPVAVYGNHTFCFLESKYFAASFAIDNHGKAWSWGTNSSGFLGINELYLASKLTPTPVYGGHTFCKISIGGYAACALDNKGKAWAWGNGYLGQLGECNGANRWTPVAVCGNHTFCRISGSMGSGFLAIDNKGKGWWWGGLDAGSCTPVAVYGNHTFCFVLSQSDRQFIAIDNHKQTWGWGYQISSSPIAITQYGLKWK